MKKEISLPKELLRENIDDFVNHVIEIIDNNTTTSIILNFREVEVIISYAVKKIEELTKVLSLLGIRITILAIPHHLALPLSQQLQDIPGLNFRNSFSVESDLTDQIDISEIMRNTAEKLSVVNLMKDIKQAKGTSEKLATTIMEHTMKNRNTGAEILDILTENTSTKNELEGLNSKKEGDT